MVRKRVVGHKEKRTKLIKSYSSDISHRQQVPSSVRNCITYMINTGMERGRREVRGEVWNINL